MDKSNVHFFKTAGSAYVPVLLAFSDGTPALPFYTKHALIELIQLGVSVESVRSIVHSLGIFIFCD